MLASYRYPQNTNVYRRGIKTGRPIAFFGEDNLCLLTAGGSAQTLFT